MSKQKEILFLKGYETNPQGNKVPIYTTVEPPVLLRGFSEQEGSPGGQPKRPSIFAGARKKEK